MALTLSRGTTVLTAGALQGAWADTQGIISGPLNTPLAHLNIAAPTLITANAVLTRVQGTIGNYAISIYAWRVR